MSGIAILGRGELGGALAEALHARVWTRGRGEALGEAVAGAACVVSAVPAVAQLELAILAAPHLASGSVYVDPSPLPPEAKEEVERAVSVSGALYADAAVLGTAAADGARVPFLVSGPGAERFRQLAEPHGLVVSALDAPTGAATRVKLLRSVFMKGRDALILEMLLAARRYGLVEPLVESIRGSGEQVPFPDLARRVMTALGIHAERRADELEASADVLRAGGVEPLVTAAGAERLSRLARLGLREHFAGERPENVEAVLAAIEKLSQEAP